MHAFHAWRQQVYAHSWILLASLSLKLLVSWSHPRAYVSTDYEVHRNWMAITWQLPPSHWYFDTTSVWTLDYPPLFAYFELLLAALASILCPAALALSGSRVDPPCLPPFHHASVLVGDVLLYGAALACVVAAGGTPTELTPRCRAVALLLNFNPALIIVDHMHFQYNSMLLALLMAVAAASYAGMATVGVGLFTALCGMKHLFMVLAPVVGVHALRGALASVRSVAALVAAPVGVVIAVMAPFLIPSSQLVDGVAPHAPADVLRQMVSRMFPFHRGLVHDYWAPNVWALYMLLDRGVVAVGRALHASWPCLAVAHSYAGSHNATCLPSVHPRVAMLAVAVAASLPALLMLRRSSARKAHAALVCAYMGAFLFGWHVHEKAILYVLIPLQVLGVLQPGVASVAWDLAAVATLAQWPLIHTPLEQTALIALSVMGLAMQWLLLQGARQQPRLSMTGAVIAGTAAVYLLLPLLAPRYQYLPQLLVSTTCAALTLLAYVRLWRTFLSAGVQDGELKEN